MRAETVRVYNEYAFNSRPIREIRKQIDPTNIKILSTMARVGPRNLLQVSRLTGIPFTTVHHRVTQIESKSGSVATLIPNVAKLGMFRIVLLASAKPGLEDNVTQALQIPNYWRVIERCEGTFTHHSIQTIPRRFLNAFREYVSTMHAMNLIKSYRIIPTEDSHNIFPDFSNYNFSSSDWTFDWDEWLREATTGVPTSVIEHTPPKPIHAERIDLEIVARLEQNGRIRFTDIARKINASRQAVKYHYDKLVAQGVVEDFDILVTPYPVEMSAYHEFMLEFADAASMNRFLSLAKKLFFIHHLSRAIRRNTLLVRTGMISSQVENMFTFFSEMANVGQLTSYSAVRLNMSSRLRQTISFELFDNVSGWQWDVYKNLLELNKM